MRHALVTILSRPVDRDCEDTIPVYVETSVERTADGALYLEFDAEVIRDAPGDDGVILFERGETIRWQSFTERNLQELEDAYQDECLELPTRPLTRPIYV